MSKKQDQDAGTPAGEPAAEFSTTAAAEAIRPGPGDVAPMDPREAKKAEGSIDKLQQQYDAALEEVRDEADPAKRQTLINRKGNVSRQLTEARRMAERAERANRAAARANPATPAGR